MSPNAPKAPKSRISAKISGTTGRAPLLEVSDTDVTSNSKRPKRVTTKRATGSLVFSDDESDQDSVTRPTKMVQRFQGPGGSTVRRPPMHQKRQSQPPMTAPEIISASVPIDGPALIEALATQHIAFNRAVEVMVAKHQKQLEQREERFKARIEAHFKAQEARINDLLKPLQETCEKTQQIYCPHTIRRSNTTTFHKGINTSILNSFSIMPHHNKNRNRNKKKDKNKYNRHHHHHHKSRFITPCTQTNMDGP
ncbi:hypothetical protein DFQ26_004636 [Actinomortierella ambigua]|nr:hypothetical protein DFQ26_004636 [Actinomortierella ambigua]